MFSLLFSATNLYIREIQTTQTLSLINSGTWIIQTVGLSLVVAPIYILIKKLFDYISNNPTCPQKLNAFQNLNQKKFFYVIFGLHLICYIPYFLAYYPGLFAYDVHTQIGEFYTTHHPLAHTLLLRFFYRLGDVLFGSHTIGIAIASVLQMLLFIGVISFMHLFLHKRRIIIYLRILFILLTLFVPYYSILSISMTKDVLYTISALLLYICVYQWSFKPDSFRAKPYCLLFLIAVISIIIFRNNGIYVLGIFLFCVSLYKFKQAKRLLAIALVGIFIALGINTGLKIGLHAHKGSGKEAFSVPLQQLSYVYRFNHEKLTDSDINWIETRIPRVKRYGPYLADYVKKKSELHKDLKAFTQHYPAILFRCPISMINAFLLLNSGNLYIFDHTNAQIYGFGLEQRQGFLLTDTKPGFGVEHTTKFAALENYSERLFSANEYFNHPILFILCSPAVYFWLILLLLFYSIQDRLNATVPLWIFVLSLLLTVIASPCVLIRYALPYILATPLLIALYIESHRVKKNLQ